MCRNLLAQVNNGYFLLSYKYKNGKCDWLIAFPWNGNNPQEERKQKQITRKALRAYKQAMLPFLMSHRITVHNKEITRMDLLTHVDGIM